MMTYLIKMTLIWGVLYVLYYVGLRRLTFFWANRFYLLAALLLGLWLPTLDLPLPVSAIGDQAPFYLPTVLIHWAHIDQAVPLTFPLITIGGSANTSATTLLPELHWWEWLYVVGAALALSRFLWGLIGLIRLYDKSERTTMEGITILQHSGIKTPFSFFNWVFWKTGLDIKSEAGQRIWQHERAHVRQGHSLDIVLLEILQIIFWFHPLVYLYRRSIQQVHEYLADAAVLRETAVRTYGRTLLWQAQGTGHPVALANHFSQSQLKNRILMMTRTRSRYTNMWRYMLGIPLMLGLMVLFLPQGTGQTATSLKEDAVFKVDNMPLFSGAETQEESLNALMNFLGKEIRYPQVAHERGIEGTTVVQFVVNKDGSVSDIKLLREVGSGLGEESVRVIGRMPNWTPGSHEGELRRVALRVPIKFRLSEEAKEQAAEAKKEAADDVFMKVDQMPLFAGTENQDESLKAVMSFVKENLRYPAVAKRQRIEGTTVVQFVISTDGAVTDVVLLRDVGGGLGGESVRVIKSMPDWVPGRQEGELRKVMLRLPISFKLPADKPAAGQSDAPDLAINTLPQDAFGVSPNPAKNRVELTFKEPLQATDVIRLFNQNGQLMNSVGVDTQVGATTRAITFAQPGVYYVQLVRAEGKMLTKRVVVQ
ncbi:MAG TPA: TonB family protein [Saprospiraceae bacterium]|nr:TonB family protein [Saprospiraceae bacterium]